MSNHAPIDTLPRARQVFCVRFQKPGGTTQTAWYAYQHAAERKARFVRAAGGDARVFTADVGTWSEPLVTRISGAATL